MWAYAPVPRFADRRPHPRALILIVGAHVAALAAVMTAKMDLPIPTAEPPLVVRPIPIPQAPPPEPKPQPPSEHRDSRLDTPPTILPVPRPDRPLVDTLPIPMPLPQPGTGSAIDPLPNVPNVPPVPVRVGPRFATPPHAMKPPYPASKLRTEEEAALRLRLTIDERGRVVAVQPVGNPDPVFLDAARRHILARWRYRPASENGRAVASTTLVTLRFELEN